MRRIGAPRAGVIRDEVDATVLGDGRCDEGAQRAPDPRVAGDRLGDTFDKGTAVAALLDVAPFCGRLPLYFGDDDTDLPALQLVAGVGGKAIAVGPRLSVASDDEHLDGPGDVRAVLHALSAALQTASAGGPSA